MRKGFTLIELMLAVLLGAMVVAMIAGSLRSSINAWTTVEKTSATNYNRRTVLDLIKRQSSSLFYQEDAQDLNSQSQTSNQDPKKRNAREMANVVGRNKKSTPKDAFKLPGNANYFKGEAQLIEFVSTVSFLSDFPGQVSVKYYVVQEEPADDEEGEENRLVGESAPPPPESISEDGMDEEQFEEMEGNLYLVMQEVNLFMNQTQQRPEPVSEEIDTEDPNDKEESGEEPYDVSFEDLMNEEDQGVTQVRLLGPLRRFSIRYRIPDTRNAESEDEDEDWETSWDVSAHNGQYPSAIEFILFYEVPGVTDDLDTEELDGIRMVIPVYSSNNLDQRGSNHGMFFED